VADKGKTLIYVCCPTCGFSRTVKKRKGSRPLDLETYQIVQFRQQYPREKGGSSKGFVRVGGLTLKEMLNNKEYHWILADLRERTLALLKEMEKLGIIEEDATHGRR